MSDDKSYVYLRTTEWFNTHGVLKLGVASDIKMREHTYITGEFLRGTYKLIIQIPSEKMRILDKMMKLYFHNYRVYKGGGTEFYSQEIEELIISYIEKTNIKYTIITDYKTSYESIEKILKNSIRKFKQKNKIIPHYHQLRVLKNIQKYYDEHDNGKIIWACGLGKTILSMLIIEKMKFQNIIIGVSYINLQKQIKDEILKIFPMVHNILMVGGRKSITTTKIIDFLKKKDTPKFIITTYHSCNLLVDEEIHVDFKIGDEAHHLVGVDVDKGFRQFHKIKSEKSLFMTATEKIIVSTSTSDTYSMDDERTFGKHIDIVTVHQAINDGNITDYDVLVIKNTEDEIDNLLRKLKITKLNKNLLISCFMSLKAIEKYKTLTHILLYTNRQKNANLCQYYINEILKSGILSLSKEDIYNKSLHSEHSKHLKSELQKFCSKPYGIISCVYLFGEGTDIPKLNGVCIGDNMNSEIRIVQSLLRPNRKDKHNPDKKAKIIIPYIDYGDWEIKNNSYEKVRHIISYMRNVDEHIEQKIIVAVGQKRERVMSTVDNQICEYDYILDENPHELEHLKLKLRHSKTLTSKYNELKVEYDYVRSINIKLNILSKDHYLKSEDIHEHFIDDPEKHFITIWKNWYHFIGIKTDKMIEDKYAFIQFCVEHDMTTLESYKMEYHKYDVLPKNPSELYSDFHNFDIEFAPYNKPKRRKGL
jgi:predicted helicase